MMKHIVSALVIASVSLSSIAARPAEARGRGLGLLLGAGLVAAIASHHHRDRWEDYHGNHHPGDVCQGCGYGMAPVYRQPVVYQQVPVAQPVAYAPQEAVVEDQPQPMYQPAAYAAPQAVARPGCDIQPAGPPQVIEEEVVKPDGSVVIRKTTTTRYIRTVTY